MNAEAALAPPFCAFDDDDERMLSGRVSGRKSM
jgi:hypothetical protein